MSFANSGDPHINPKEGNFEFTKGTYTMVGIEDYFSKDETEPVPLPIFKPIQNELRAHCHLKTEESMSQFPAWSGTVQDYVRLGKALGADLTGLKQEATTEFLVGIKSRINATKAVTQIYAGENGWVKKINALLPPSSIYRIAFKKAYSLDGTEPVRFQEKESTFNGKTIVNSLVRFHFEIVSDAEDNTDYAGTTFTIDVFNPWEGVFKNLPSWKHAKNGGMLNAQRRMMAFLNVFWPESEDYQWVIDPEESEYGINEAENPIWVIVNKAAESGKQALAYLETTDTGFIKMDMLKLALSKSAIPTTAKPVEDTKTVPADTVKIHMNLIKVINDYAFAECDGNALVSEPGNPYAFTTRGLEWCRKNVAPVWDAIGLPKDERGKRAFGILDSEQAKNLVAALEAKLGTPEF